MTREIPLYTTDGVPEARITNHPMVTEDGLTLDMLRFWKADCDDVVMIIHGLTTSSDMFIMPEHKNLVMWLHEQGLTDVFTFDFRMSNRHIYNLEPHRYSMDDCALFDHPLALDTIREVAGTGKRIHVICHCLGSMSFVMSLFAQKAEGVTSVIANSVALTPNPPTWSVIKGRVFPFMIERIFNLPYVSPNWADYPPWSLGRLFGKTVSLFHQECNVPACHMLSLMWGTGWPALYEHHNLAHVTHRRGGDLYGGTSLNYHRHVIKMIDNNHTAVRMYPNKPEHAALPKNYLQYAKDISTPVLFLTGRDNRVFADSNIRCFKHLETLSAVNNHELLILDGYGHQDPFMGERVADEVFPQFLPFLRKHAPTLAA